MKVYLRWNSRSLFLLNIYFTENRRTWSSTTLTNSSKIVKDVLKASCSLIFSKINVQKNRWPRVPAQVNLRWLTNRCPSFFGRKPTKLLADILTIFILLQETFPKSEKRQKYELTFLAVTSCMIKAQFLSLTLLILKFNTTIEDVQMMLKWFLFLYWFQIFKDQCGVFRPYL